MLCFCTKSLVKVDEVAKEDGLNMKVQRTLPFAIRAEIFSNGANTTSCISSSIWSTGHLICGAPIPFILATTGP